MDATITELSEEIRTYFGSLAAYHRSEGKQKQKRRLHAKAFWKHFKRFKQVHGDETSEQVFYHLCASFGISIDLQNPNEVTIDKKPAKCSKFYSSWKKVRYTAYLIYGRKCSCCGAINDNVQLSVDHIKPKTNFPKLELDIRNLQIMCTDCNEGKDSWSHKDFRSEQQKLKAITCYHFPDVISEFD